MRKINNQQDNDEFLTLIFSEFEKKLTQYVSKKKLNWASIENKFNYLSKSLFEKLFQQREGNQNNSSFEDSNASFDEQIIEQEELMKRHIRDGLHYFSGAEETFYENVNLIEDNSIKGKKELITTDILSNQLKMMRYIITKLKKTNTFGLSIQ